MASIVELRIAHTSPFVGTALLNAFGSPTILCILGRHLMINLKEAAERGMNEGTSYRLQTISSDIEFDELASGSSEGGTLST
ncbi:uncharacterized protein FOMMEDRAFT_159377 [Fomitiporia mediterranea MF3/22]|uniref:uncharacterized protein n=1 Tax=Fomitiporia mediterranea (strain MF3/22) TaxID=694068 RepID=UPI0004407EE9|nr:uncharacterized protein FOMMEDRAFT_159377 [Fomitiporia mediterranea MF3/22]EJD00616.1 hypothetical protein FOMMEDRAFT_159377 [Fomitiporia mediterranea MF3/22]